MTTRMKTIKLSSIKPNPDNPRVMKDDQFRKLVENIKKYPHFLEKRGIVHADGVILGGNMRYRAIQEALKDEAFRATVGVSKQTEIPASWVQDASEWSEEDRQAFIILDNSPEGVSGEWDWDLLANHFDAEELNDLGLAFEKEMEDAIKDSETLPKMELQPYEHYDYILVLAENVHDWEYICERLGIERVVSKEIKKCKRVGLGRCVSAKRVIEVIDRA